MVRRTQIKMMPKPAKTTTRTVVKMVASGTLWDRAADETRRASVSGFCTPGLCSLFVVGSSVTTRAWHRMLLAA